MAATMDEEEGFFWLWYGDNGEFRPFDGATMDLLEEARLRGEDNITVQLGPNLYTLSLTTLEQTNQQTGHARPITSSTRAWYWRDDDGHTWNRYNRDDALQLALADLSIRDRSTCFVRGNSTYFCDLERRVQQNIGTGYEREIRSGLLPVEAAAAAASPSAGVAHAVTAGTHGGIDGNDDSSSCSSSVNEEELPEHLVAQAPQSYICPISKKIMKDPVSTLEGSTYERKYIKRHLRRNNNDPVTGRTLPSKHLVDNRTLRDMIDWWKEDWKQRHMKSNHTEASPDPSMPARVSSISSIGNASRESSDRLHDSGPLSLSSAVTPLPTITMDFAETYTRLKNVQDTIKVVCLGLSNIGSDIAFRNPLNANRKPGIHRYNWNLQSTGPNNGCGGVHCNVYDFAGQKVHHASQKLFFSPRSIYVIVWDMAASNPDSFPSKTTAAASPGATTVATPSGEVDTVTAAIERDIFERVHFWVEAIQKAAPGAIILPVVSLDGKFGSINEVRQNNLPIHSLEEDEIKRRCIMLKHYFEKEVTLMSQHNICFGNDDNPVPRVSGSTDICDGLKALKGLVLQLAGESNLFPQLWQAVPPLHQEVRDMVTNISNEGIQAVALSEMINNDSGVNLDYGQLRSALRWLSDTGEILYYGAGDEDDELQSSSDILNDFAVLDPDLLVTALSKVLRADLHDSYHGPVAARDDLCAIWQSMVSSSSDAIKAPADLGNKILADFLSALFSHWGVVVTLNVHDEGANSNAELVFLPGLLGPGEHGDFVGLYNNTIFSKTMLAQSLQFYAMVSPVLLEKVCASLLQQIYARAVLEDEQGISEGQLVVKNILCWHTLLYFRLGLNTRTSDGGLQTSVVDIYAHMVDSTADLCVGATFLGGAQQSLILSAKGEEGNDAEVIWKGGYAFITEAAKQAVDDFENVKNFERHFFCPSCLAQQQQQKLRDTRAWGEWVLQRALLEGEAELNCDNRHTEKIQLLIGRTTLSESTGQLIPSAVPPDVRADELMPGVVMVGLFDEKRPSEKIRKVGSGFVVDSERGLIVTAAHTLMKLWGQEDFGRDNDGIEGAKAIIGVIPSGMNSDGSCPSAIFRYFAKILTKDINLENGECHVDACVLQITSRFENDVDGNGDLCAEEISVCLSRDPSLLKEQNLTQLEVTEESHLGEAVRILGFDQPDNTRVNRSFGVSAGTVQKQFETKAPVGGERFRYMPRKKTVLSCNTIGGHSGGPCVNQSGQVIGILSCADFTERSRSYLVPTSEWIHLVPKKKNTSTATAVGSCCAESSSGPFPPKRRDADGTL